MCKTKNKGVWGVLKWGQRGSYLLTRISSKGGGGHIEGGYFIIILRQTV